MSSISSPPSTKKRNRKNNTGGDEVKSLETFRRLLDSNNITIPPTLVYGNDPDATLLRYLRARKFDLEAALCMFRDTLRWRHQHHVDDIFQKPLDPAILAAIRKYKPGGYIGFDRQERPLYVDRIGLLNEEGLAQSGVTLQLLVRYHIQEMEYMGRVLMTEASERVGRTIDKVSMIVDVKQVSLSLFTKNVRQTFETLSKIDSDNYPETLGLVFIVNAGFAFRAIWKICSGFLDAHTVSKIRVLGPDDLDQLRQALDPHMIPEFLGGTCKYAESRETFARAMDDYIYAAQEQGGGGGEDGRRASGIQEVGVAAKGDQKAPPHLASAEVPAPISPSSPPARPASLHRYQSVDETMDPDIVSAVQRVDELIARLRENKLVAVTPSQPARILVGETKPRRRGGCGCFGGGGGVKEDAFDDL